MFDATFGYFVLSGGRPSFPFPFHLVTLKGERLDADPLTRVPHLVATKKKKKNQQELDVIMVTVMHRPPSVTVSLQLAGIFFILSRRSHIRGLKTGLLLLFFLFHASPCNSSL